MRHSGLSQERYGIQQSTVGVVEWIRLSPTHGQKHWVTVDLGNDIRVVFSSPSTLTFSQGDFVLVLDQGESDFATGPEWTGRLGAQMLRLALRGDLDPSARLRHEVAVLVDETTPPGTVIALDDSSTGSLIAAEPRRTMLVLQGWPTALGKG